MKFQKLTIHNIASIEDAVIDFAAEPLADSEVFLITGKTGAGKSTILDAICLALYADTPRLSGTKMQGATLDAKKEVKIDDPRQLMRRNTAEAQVSLTFIGSNGISYEATWAVARSRKKISGSIQSKTWELKNLDTGTTLTKGAEIEKEIQTAVGLGFNQFCRTTMLAQGEFTRFLNSKDDEKAEILEKITGVDIYSKIGAKVFELTAQKKQEWENARRLVDETRTLSDEEIKEKNRQIAELDAKQQELRATRDRKRVKRDWIRTDKELAKEVAKQKEELRKATEMVESNDFKTKETRIKEWNATIDARSWMTEAEQACQIREEQQKALEMLATEFAAILGGHQYNKQEILKIADEKETLSKFLDKEKEKTPVYENVQTIVGQLTVISEGRAAIAKCNDEIAKENKSLTEDWIPVFERARHERKEAKEALKKEESEVKRLEEEVNTLRLRELRTQRDAAKELLGNILTAKERIQTYESAKEQKEALHESLNRRQKAIEEKKTKSAGMDAPIHDAEIRKNTRKEDLDRQKESIDIFTKALCLKLQVGDTCPVCRQTIVSELPHEKGLSTLISGLQESFESAEKEHKELVDAKHRLDAEIKAESAAYGRDFKAFQEDKSVSNAEAKAQEACRTCGIDQFNETAQPALETLESSTKAQREELDAKIRNGEMKESAVQRHREELDRMRKSVDKLTEKEQKAEKVVNDCKGRITTAETLVGTKKQEVAAAEQKVQELVVADIWEIDWNKSPAEFGKALTSAAYIYNTKKRQKQSLVSQLDTAQANHQHVTSVIGTITEAMPVWKSIEASSTVKVERLSDKANSISNRVTAVLTRLKSANEHYSTNKSKLETFLSENESLSMERLATLQSYSSHDIMRENDELKKYRDAVVAQNTLLENANQQYDDHQRQRPELSETETLETLTEQIEGYEKQLTEFGEQKGAINQELKTDTENKQKLSAFIKDADEKKAVYQKWSRLNQLIGNSTGSTFRKIAQSYVLTSLIHSANSYMRTLTDRYTLKVTPGTFVISLEDAYQGFVSRAASTISGGESFLVSLSLALALSDIGQQWQVDTLFIDEGFGTLSGEPLQKAIETLRSLHSKSGRHVGIISHVEELQERIPVQIQVNQEGNNSSSKIRIVPEHRLMPD